MSSVNPSLQNPAATAKTAKQNMLPMKSQRLPMRSANLPKKRRKAPPDRDDEAEIHVISALLMCRSRPMMAVTTVVDPAVKLPMPTAIVAVRTKRTSVAVDLKQLGRASSSCVLIFEIMGDTMLVSGAFSGDIAFLVCVFTDEL